MISGDCYRDVPNVCLRALALPGPPDLDHSCRTRHLTGLRHPNNQHQKKELPGNVNHVGFKVIPTCRDCFNHGVAVAELDEGGAFIVRGCRCGRCETSSELLYLHAPYPLDVRQLSPRTRFLEAQSTKNQSSHPALDAHPGPKMLCIHFKRAAEINNHYGINLQLRPIRSLGRPTTTTS